MSSNKVKLKSIDNKIFEVPIEILRKAKLISGMIDQESDDNKIILIREVKGKYIKQILNYLKYNKNLSS